MFNVWWKGDMVTYSDGQLHLGISDANGEVEQGYYGGEARTGLYYGYGDYVVEASNPRSYQYSWPPWPSTK